MKRCALTVAAAFVCVLSATPPALDIDALTLWPTAQRERYAAYEQSLVGVATADSLRAWHDKIASEPHIAGTPGDERQIQRIAEAMRDMGLEVEIHEFWPLLATPVAAAVDIISPVHMSLPVKESPVPGDPDTAHPDQWPGFAAYSGSGDVVGEVVYANYGRLEDFARLRELGIDCTGKIVICRYGGNYRGFKAVFAQQAGAAGLLVYTDPADTGYVQGLEYPEGGWAGPEHIQRGSYINLGYPGDPLTPLREATEDADRLPWSALEANLLRIPVQPIGYGAAREIMQHMTGEPAPQAWRGGLPFVYRLTGGPDLRVRVHVEQKREIKKTANVIGRITGEIEPDRWIIIGSHHDAWGCGAADPTSGTICMLEAARAFGELARRGHRPRRTILFAAWGAEEWGIIGSTEWVEGRAAELREKAVAYINLDMSTTGPHFGASATPSLKRIILDASRTIPQARQPDRSVFDAWISRTRDITFPEEPGIGDLGGGSDHIGFCCFLSVPSMALSASGGPGTSYHGINDTLRWYRKVVGEDYEPALMVTRMTLVAASRLASAPLLPLDNVRTAVDTRRHLLDLSRRANELRLPLSFLDDAPLAAEFAEIDAHARLLQVAAARFASAIEVAMPEGLPRNVLEKANAALMAAEAAWISDPPAQPLPGRRPWFQNMYVATDPNTGYGAWMLPMLREEIEYATAGQWRAMGRGVSARERNPAHTIQAYVHTLTQAREALLDAALAIEELGR
ncbi:MAG: M20/M25/M40 family metallo-hydrolase [Phycisphaeraceae bacterium]|nr:M20/M25/M40 family metallo-hydrolase [Phycisphaeraceae bacterium]MCW5754289.1 M20/M25/M40 family metallo-hydrolase [Phycisphaeraceae bacterium]